MTVIYCLMILLAIFLAGGITENCMTWAVRNRIMRGGTILVRRSLFAHQILAPEDRRGLRYWLALQVPHFLWARPDGCVVSYTVREEGKERRRHQSVFLAWLELWFYDGYVLEGDAIFGDYYRASDPWFRWEKV